jgi:hypothetical protein
MKMGKISHILNRETRRKPRFGLLFLTLLLALALPSFLPHGTAFQLAVQILITGVLLAGLTSVSRGTRLMLIGIAVVLPAIALNWLARLVDQHLIIASNVLAIAFLIYLAILIINYLLQAERADANSIYGGLCVFMLLGFIWGLAFFVFDVIDPGSLSTGGAALADDIGGLLEATSKSIYLSFVTLTTLGYGDVTPAIRATRSLAVLEAIIGQLYLIVMISRFVALNVADSMAEAQKRAGRSAAEAPQTARVGPSGAEDTV